MGQIAEKERHLFFGILDRKADMVPESCGQVVEM